ncbi:heme-binding protein 2-like [Lytechinus variegatus]|uniref:heme-binding protein 2-like n=1 Tax=Lytechinus variegatus TaxID=7654 RepID=UPI001BB1FD1A|nr:heme-binding protein 2-like [Lytechinus variegatus]
MAKPVRTQVASLPVDRSLSDAHGGGGDGQHVRYTISFFASRKRVLDLPNPLDQRIFFDEQRPTRFYALSFGGFPISHRVDVQFHQLIRLLPNSNQNQSDLLGSSFFTDVYDTPMKLTNRHNEILIPLKVDDNPRRWCSTSE